MKYFKLRLVAFSCDKRRLMLFL